MTVDTDTILITRSDPGYAEQQQRLMESVYDCKFEDPDSEIFSAEIFRHQQNLFPEGQFMALFKERVIGFTVSMLFPFDPDHPFIEPWFTTISDGWLKRHDANAEWMYGVESCVDQRYQSQGVGGALMQARYDVAQMLNVRGLVAGSGLISYRENTEKYGGIEPNDYIQRVVAGTLYDTNLTKQIKKGFRPVAVIPNYLHDSESMGWGAVIVWDNPQYDPAKGRGKAEARTYEIALRPKAQR